MQRTRQALEIGLEQMGERFWLAALANTLSGAFGSGQFRFVGRVRTEDGGESPDDVIGATFPMMRFHSLDDAPQPDGWEDTARERLHELDLAIREAGWQPEEARGDHWWSLRYTRG